MFLIDTFIVSSIKSLLIIRKRPNIDSKPNVPDPMSMFNKLALLKMTILNICFYAR